ncbi:MAG TPA: pilus assembly protein TadG-related protein [Sphingomicrobium sp.]|nr:pilus assembly protein TadG-related protein [Sphingomicrobium sp.]
MRCSIRRLYRNDGGAVAPTIALALLGLVAAGGIAFDYARLASLDTELQQAADQAALAAATQLDGQSGACARAAAAAQSLVANLTYFANDGGGPGISIPLEPTCDATGSVRFYQNYDPVTGAKAPASNSDANANYVEVTVGTRTARYALTPIVAAFSGNASASALATLDSAYCNLPPFLMCKPGPTFNAADHIGHGLRLVIGSTVAPGNFGFLQTGFGSGAENLAKAIGWNGSAGGCVAARGVITEPGNKQSVRAALNTRFDLSESGQTCPAGGTCSPSTNSRKDLVHGNNCGIGGGQGWRETDNPYRAPNTTPLGPGNPMNATHTYPDIMGHPRDLCHAVSEAGTCGPNGTPAIVGNGVWDRDAYFWVNYGWDHATWTTNTGLQDTNPSASNYATRYKVYLWEAANPLPNGANGPGIGNNQQVDVAQGSGTQPRWSSSWTGATPNPQRTCRAPGIPPGNLDTDRRTVAVAVVDCTGLNGRDTVVPVDWVDVFLVEPTIRRPGSATDPPGAVRTDDGDVYVEIVGTRPLPGVNQSIGNVIRRDVPRLIE